MIVEKFYANGKLISKRLTDSWLINNNLYNWLHEETGYLNKDSSNRFRLYCIENGIKHQPKCVCGKDVFLNYDSSPVTLRKYCSSKCSAAARDKDVFKDINHSIANEKRARTNIEKYGVAYNSQRKEVRDIISSTQTQRQLPEKARVLLDKEWLLKEYESKTATEIANNLNCYYGTVIDYLRKYGAEIRQYTNVSVAENEISDFLNDNNIEHIKSDRKLISPYELDILIPSHNLAIEHHGLYWHKEEQIKHSKKYEMCKVLGYTCMQFFEDEWKHKQDICKSMILSKLGIYKETIYARKTTSKQIDNYTAKQFLDDNHIQGYAIGKHYGLFHENDLVCMITIGKSRFEKNKTELIRLCTKKNTLVVGGFTKLLKNNTNEEIISYCDKRFSTGNVYESVGGEKLSETSPNYYWVDSKSLIRISRFNTQKHKLCSFLKEKYDPTMSESENMYKAGYSKIYDCGNIKYSITISAKNKGTEVPLFTT